MKEVSSSALDEMNRALGLAGGSGGAQTTVLEDGLLQQVIEVSDLVSRSRSIISENLKVAVFENVHAVAESVVSAVDPYFMTSSPGSAPNWPVPVPAGWDIWVLRAAGVVTATNANFSNGYLGIAGDFAGDAAFTQDNVGGAATGGIRIPIQSWDDATVLGGLAFLTDGGEVSRHFSPFRIPRGMTLEFRTTTITGGGTYQAGVLLGLFPSGLGQDAAT